MDSRSADETRALSEYLREVTELIHTLRMLTLD